jgi:hypothetical protein
METECGGVFAGFERLRPMRNHLLAEACQLVVDRLPLLVRGVVDRADSIRIGPAKVVVADEQRVGVERDASGHQMLSGAPARSETPVRGRPASRRRA